VDYTVPATETGEPFTLVFENTVRSTGGGLATVFTSALLTVPKTGTRSASALIGTSTNIANFPDATDNLTIRVQADSSDGGAGITNDRIFVDQAYLHSN